MNIKDYKKVDYIEESGRGVDVMIDGEFEDNFDDMCDAQDTVEDMLNEELRGEYKYYCSFCQEYYNEVDVYHRIQDETFTAPFGSTVIIGRDVTSVPVCPNCSDDLEDC